MLTGRIIFTVCWLAWLLVPYASAGPRPDSRLSRIFQPEENWSVVIVDSQQNAVIFKHRADQPRIPASNLKIYVTAAGFDLLGSRFRYRTPLLGHGSLEPGGVWRGDIMVRGSGDPTFSGRFEEDKKDVTARLERWAKGMVQYGIKEIRGNLYGNDDIFDEDYWGKGWPDDSWCDWYTAPSGGLILNDSCIDVAVYPNKRVGGPPLVETIPPTGFLTITNEAKTVPQGRKNGVAFRRSFDQNDLRILGTISADSGGTQHAVAITNPTEYFISVFKEVIEREGIRMDGIAMDADSPDAPALPPRGWKVLSVAESPPLSELAKVINKRSQNLFADSLLKKLGSRKAGMGNWAGGSEVVRSWVASLGIPAPHLRLEDGSGLSRLNRITAEDTVALLLEIQKKPWVREFKDSLAVSGDPVGSLRRRLRTPELKGRVHAKTGYIDGVFALSGYLDTHAGKTYVFSFLFNGKSHGRAHPHHRMEDALTILATEQP